MDFTNLSETELKALGYDAMSQIEQGQIALSAIAMELKKRQGNLPKIETMSVQTKGISQPTPAEVSPQESQGLPKDFLKTALGNSKEEVAES